MEVDFINIFTDTIQKMVILSKWYQAMLKKRNLFKEEVDDALKISKDIALRCIGNRHVITNQDDLPLIYESTVKYCAKEIGIINQEE